MPKETTPSTEPLEQQPEEGSANDTKPSRFEHLMGEMAKTRQFPIDLQPINSAPIPAAPRKAAE